MKILHLADVHIKNLKYHDIYQDVFGQLYETAKNEKVDAIICCGDIAHTKTNISPEFVDMASRFFNNLADIAPLYIIAGNHDGNLRNLDRQDAITPIVEAINRKEIFFLKNSGECQLNDKITLNVLSIFDRDNWIKPTDVNKINIALYHGAIEGSRTDTGWAMKETDDDISIFDDFDYALLGDIHKRQFLGNSFSSRKGNVAYPGSLVQQNFGEEIDKGALLWDIQEKNKFTVKPINFKNPSPFITINYDPAEDLKLQPNSFLRVILDKFYSRDKILKIKEEIHKKCDPRSIVVIEKRVDDTQRVTETSKSQKLNLRDENVQSQLIKEYLQQDNLDEDTIKSVLDLNTKYNLEAEISDDCARNVKWSLSSLEWNNLFNYEEDNKILFDELSGVVGVFGKNYSGKSSIIDSLLYTIFNSTSKKIRKNFDVVNEKRTSGDGRAIIKIRGEDFSIKRSTEKVVKKSKGKIVEEGKTSVDFVVGIGEDEKSLNGNDRMETDKNIRREIGSIEDFCNTSLSTQHGSLDFVNEGSTKRKEILANFLDLQVFERKHKPANQEANELKSLIKKLQVKDCSKLLSEAVTKKEILDVNLHEIEENMESLKKARDEKMLEVQRLDDGITKVDINLNIKDLERKKSYFEDLIEKCHGEISRQELNMEKLGDSLDLLEQEKSLIDAEYLLDIKNKEAALVSQHSILSFDISSKKKDLDIHNKNREKIKLASCGTSQFNDCSFKKSALESQRLSITIKSELSTLQQQLEEMTKEIDALMPHDARSKLDSFAYYKENIAQSEIHLLKYKLFLNEENENLRKHIDNLNIINSNLKKYEDNKEFYENINELRGNKLDIENEIKIINQNIVTGVRDKLEIIKKVAAMEQVILGLEEQRVELERLNKEYSAYELFLKCVHNNGIPFELIKKSLPIINEEINKLLCNVVDFEANFENEDGKLEIYITHPGYSSRSIENCSGAEKSLVAMAIRLALVKCGSLPVSDIFILDEPATSLDAEHLEGFVRVLDMIKSEFKVVLLVTHLETLKDSVDKIIEVQKNEDGFASIN